VEDSLGGYSARSECSEVFMVEIPSSVQFCLGLTIPSCTM
jgi:hypothetical protein